MTGILAAFGLAAATGLNAYLPFLIVGLLARYTTLAVVAPALMAAFILLAAYLIIRWRRRRKGKGLAAPYSY